MSPLSPILVCAGCGVRPALVVCHYCSAPCCAEEAATFFDKCPALGCGKEWMRFPDLQANVSGPGLTSAVWVPPDKATPGLPPADEQSGPESVRAEFAPLSPLSPEGGPGDTPGAPLPSLVGSI